MESTPNTQRSKPRGRKRLALLVIVLLAVAAWGIVSRIQAADSLRTVTFASAVPTVSIMKAAAGPAEEEIVLPGDVQAWHEAPVYARTNGYLKSWATDIGTHVKEGDPLAEIETPEIDAQFHQAEADLHTAEANNVLAQSTAVRWQKLLKTNSVSQQEADEKTSDAAAKAAMVASAKANLDHLQQLEDFKHVVAPFEGTITARKTDIGALINAGSGGVGQELFRIADTSKLRIYVQIPQINAQVVKADTTAELHFVEYPNRTFSAKLTRTAEALAPDTRTLLAEFEADNDKGELFPGGYAEVHIKLPSDTDHVHLPINTLIFNSAGSQVATIDDQNHAVLIPIKIGRDYGKEIEVIDGVKPGQTIIVNPPDSLVSGQTIKIVTHDDKAPANAADDKSANDKGTKKP